MTTEQSFSIGSVRLSGRFGVAPMAGVGDYAFRTICREHGAAYSVSEMVSAKALCYGDKKTEQLLYLGETEHPSAVQIFGSEPEFLARGAKIALEMSRAEILDINMGCPAGKIIRSGEGSALMKTPELARACIEAVVAAVNVPVTVKFRAGWDETSRNAVEFAQMAAKAGASALCVHGRTRAQMYAGEADRALMRAVVEAVEIPVMVNGDVTDAASGLRLLNETGAKFALVGRGALGNPWVFAECHAALNGEAFAAPDLQTRLSVAQRQAQIAAEQKGEGTACRELRAHMMYY
ncbi:MAG: tRNA dihydrouridine synthase DusB, partial [Clostridia bacterium]|nr:tRNA dihydrouridine synthase DusB [Clostridia bacterium]